MSGAPIPKPPKRGPKPRKPLKRASRPIARGSRPAAVRRSQSGKAKHSADIAWAKAVRAKGPCIARGMRLFSDTEWRVGEMHGRMVTIEHQRCDEITAAHVLRRGYLATRHDLDNGVPLCFSAHSFFTRHPDQWQEFISSYLGAGKYEALRRKAIQGPKQTERFPLRDEEAR